jgi:hypothetical protein
VERQVRSFCRRRDLRYADHGDDIKQDVLVELLKEFGDRPEDELDRDEVRKVIRKSANKYTQQAVRKTRHRIWKQAPTFAGAELRLIPEPNSFARITEEVFVEIRKHLSEDAIRKVVVHAARKAHVGVEELNKMSEITGVTVISNELDGAASDRERQEVKRLRDKLTLFIRGLIWPLVAAASFTWSSGFAQAHQGSSLSIHVDPQADPVEGANVILKAKFGDAAAPLETASDLDGSFRVASPNYTPLTIRDYLRTLSYKPRVGVASAYSSDPGEHWRWARNLNQTVNPNGAPVVDAENSIRSFSDEATPCTAAVTINGAFLGDYFQTLTNVWDESRFDVVPPYPSFAAKIRTKGQKVIRIGGQTQPDQSASPIAIVRLRHHQG